MCATLQNRGESMLMRAYLPPADAIPVSKEAQALADFRSAQKLTITEATRATSAAPTYFPELNVKTKDGPPAEFLTFWDGGLLNNNPIDQVWRARLDLVNEKEAAPKVGCILSIGTSWSTADPPGFLDAWIPAKSDGKGWTDWFKNQANKIMSKAEDMIQDKFPMLDPVQRMIPFLTNTEAKHLDFQRYINRLKERPGTTEVDHNSKYFRFNTPTNEVYIDMSKYEKMEQLRGITERWLTTNDAKGWVNECATMLVNWKKSRGS
jgi:hypothetical protein